MELLFGGRDLIALLMKPVNWLRFGSVLKADETVVFFPQSARKNPQGGWVVPVHAWVVELESQTLIRRFGRQAVYEFLDLVGMADEQQPVNPLFADRLEWFLADREINKRLLISIAGREYQSPRTSRNGHVRFEILLDDEAQAGRLLAFSVLGSPAQVVSSCSVEQLRSVLPVSEACSAGLVPAGVVELVAPEGLSVISDIDDTIKVSNVTDRHQLVKGIFFEPYKAVPGMAKLYACLQEQGASFHYVSSSPLQLYPSLQPFLEKNYPFGSVSLRRFFVGDRSIVDFFHSSMSYKKKAIATIMDNYPERHFLLVGDSGEKDPEVYCDIACQYPERVSGLLIRNVGNEEADDTERWAGLRERLQSVPLLVFDQPPDPDCDQYQWLLRHSTKN